MKTKEKIKDKKRTLEEKNQRITENTREEIHENRKKNEREKAL